jgi:hypothetical protein
MYVISLDFLAEFDFRPGTRVRFLTLILALFAGLKMWTGFFLILAAAANRRALPGKFKSPVMQPAAQ